MRQLRNDFDQLRESRHEGSVRDADRAMDRLDQAVVRFVLLMDQNLQMLGAKFTTNFGDVTPWRARSGRTASTTG